MSSAEGFLCPKCIKDLGSIEDLLAHLATAHLDADDNAGGSESAANFVQAMGSSRSWTELFVSLRPSVLLATQHVEISQLIIRLSNLLPVFAIKEQTARRRLEQSVVRWLPDDKASVCCICGKSFDMFFNRKHHCRLCGRVICRTCLLELSYKSACEILQQPTEWTDESAEPVLVCRNCHQMLNKELARSKAEAQHKHTTSLYAVIVRAAANAEASVAEYNALVRQLNATGDGELYRRAKLQREGIMHLLAEQERDSQRLVAVAASPRQQLLHGNVRRYVQGNVQQVITLMQALPDADSLDSLAAAERARIEQRLERERVAKARLFDEQRQSSQSSIAQVVTNESSHPFLVQINRLRSFIEQAQRAGRLDEVAILEDSLADVTAAYRQVEKGL